MSHLSVIPLQGVTLAQCYHEAISRLRQQAKADLAKAGICFFNAELALDYVSLHEDMAWFHSVGDDDQVTQLKQEADEVMKEDERRFAAFLWTKEMLCEPELEWEEAA